jgi:phospholipid-binding lipoprotein MlaA
MDICGLVRRGICMFVQHPALAALLLGFAMCACAGPNKGARDQNDPWEPFNRAMFTGNQALDKAIALPASQFYNRNIPEPARTGIHNALYNLDQPVTLANDVLQGERTRATQTLSRLAVNSTIGIGGILDEATRMGMPNHTEDFGQTLGVYGVDEGPYLVLPLLGPAPPRDLAGRVVDNLFDPFTYAKFRGQYVFAGVRAGLGVIDLRARNIDTLDQIERSSVDLYAAERSLYRQYRNSEIHNGKQDASDLPDL